LKTQISHYYLIVDLEATCCDNRTIPRHQMEIIEIGAVMLNRTTWEIDSEFQQFIQPVRHPHLTEFCKLS
jgi:inhibitor of KinA sporulation pathway (predicted exonuclease)